MTRSKISDDTNHVVASIRLGRICAVAAALVAISGTASLAQAAAPVEPTATSTLAAVPTTKLLAIGSFTAKATPDVWKPVLPSEVRATVRLYLDGKIDQWYLKQDQSGVVFVMNLTDPQEARALLDKLPLGQAGLMEFQFIQLGPISPLRLLLAESLTQKTTIARVV
jgi:hypothetical protein